MKKLWTFFAGMFIVTGTAVGAGMLAIPTASAGVWFWRSLLVLVATWLVLMSSSLMILEAGQNFDTHDHFPTMVKKLLGPAWAHINSFSTAFVLYLLVYAYITVGGGLSASGLSTLGFTAPQWIGQSLFFLVLGLVVWLSQHWLARFNAIIVGGLFLTFFMAIGALLPQIHESFLWPQNPQQEGSWRYLLTALPVAFAAFGYHINVPTLRMYFKGESKKIAWALFGGSALALVLYVLWQIVILGNLPRDHFGPVIAKGGDVAVLLSLIDPHGGLSTATQLMKLFSYFAIATSFLGVALGLLEFLSDFFHLPKDGPGRFKSAALALIPPFILSLYSPLGFTNAIGWVGVAFTIWGAIIPALMLLKVRQQGPKVGAKGVFRICWGKPLAWLVIFFAALNIAAKFAEVFHLVPVFS